MSKSVIASSRKRRREKLLPVVTNENAKINSKCGRRPPIPSFSLIEDDLSFIQDTENNPSESNQQTISCTKSNQDEDRVTFKKVTALEKDVVAGDSNDSGNEIMVPACNHKLNKSEQDDVKLEVVRESVTNKIESVQNMQAFKIAKVKNTVVPRDIVKESVSKEANPSKKKTKNTEKAKDGTAKQNSRKRNTKVGASSNASRRKQCTLCLTCSCNQSPNIQSLEDGTLSENQNPLLGLARSDAEIERALIGRLARLEKSAFWFDGLCTKVDRELKRHRNKMKAKMKESDMSDKPKFISDVETMDGKQYVTHPLTTSLVNRAKRRTFSFRKKAQITLTQMLATSDESEDEELAKEPVNDVIEVDEDEVELDSDQNCNDTPNERYTDYVEARSKGKGRHLWNASRLKEKNAAKSEFFEETISFSEDDQEGEETNLYKSMGVPFDASDSDDGMLELLDIFDTHDCNINMTDMHENKNSCWDDQTLVLQNEAKIETTHSQLSPMAKLCYEDMRSRIDASPYKVQILNGECPSWEENIRFALQQSPTDVREALVNVRQKRHQFLKAIEILQKKNVVLDMYEMVLTESLNRDKSCQDWGSVVMEQS